MVLRRKTMMKPSTGTKSAYRPLHNITAATITSESTINLNKSTNRQETGTTRPFKSRKITKHLTIT